MKNFKLTKEQILNIKEGQKITFNYFGDVYTKKVQCIYEPAWNKGRVDLLKFNVNKIGCGTGWTGVEAFQIIQVK